LLLSTATLVTAITGYGRQGLLAFAVMAGLGLWAGPALSQSVWTPGTNDYNLGTNWTPNGVPAGTAIFDTNTFVDLNVTASTTLGGWTFNTGAGAYTFANTVDLEFTGAGIAVNAGSATITNGASSNLIFDGTATTAGGAKIINNASAEINFNDSSNAGSATIINKAGADTYFFANSQAGSATITNDDTLYFEDTSTAGSATITNNAKLRFYDTSTGGSATITNNSNLQFYDTSTGGQAQILTNAMGVTDFSGSTGPLDDGRLTAGSLAGVGDYFLGANELTVGGNNLSSEVSGVISDCGTTNDCLDHGATGGSLIKTGAGTFTLSSVNFYTGPTTVNGGTLVVNGSIVSDVTVNNGGILGGTGQIGALTVGNGGIYAPGNSIGTQTVNGNFVLAAGAVYQVEVNAAGQSDKVIVNGTVNLTGATLRVLAANGNYKPKTKYTIIDNDGSDAVKGTFAKITSSLAFLVPTVIYDGGTGNDVVLTLAQKSRPGPSPVSFCSVADTSNQCNVAHALDQFPTDNALFLAVLNQTAEGARQAFDALSGEIHATVSGVLADDSRYVREAVLGRLMQANVTGAGNTQTAALAAAGPQVASLDSSAMALGYGKSLSAPAREPLAFWTRAYGAWGDFSGDGNAATADRDLGGFISGMDAQLSGSWRAGLATGASFSNMDVDARYSYAKVETYHLGGYLGGMAGAFALRGGGMWAWSDIDTSRAVVFPGFFERQTASYGADTGQLFGEVAYPTSMSGMAVEPFTGLAYVSLGTDTFRERGGALASLRGSGTDENVGYSTLGLRAASTMQWGAMLVTPHISAAWQHAFDGVTPGAALAFASTGIGFGISGAPLAQDSALIDAGLDLALGPTTAGVSYSGQFGDGVQDNAVKGRFAWLF